MLRRCASVVAVTSLVMGLLAAPPVAAGDRKSPKIAKARMADADGDGSADRVVLVYTERIRHKADKDGKYPFSIEGFKIRKIPAAKGRKLVILLKESAGPTEPVIGYKPSKRQPVKDRAGNQARKQSFTDVVPFAAELGPGSTMLVVVPEGPGEVVLKEGLACAVKCSAVYDTGEQVELTAVPSVGAVFLGWGGACAGSTPVCTVTLHDDATVSALFGWPVTVTIDGSGSVRSADGSIDCPGKCSVVMEEGDRVVLTASPAVGSSFTGWTGACSGTAAGCSAAVDGPETVGASFEEDDLVEGPIPLPTSEPVPLPSITMLAE